MTVRIRSLLRKLGASDGAQAAVWALNHGGSVGAEAASLPAHLHGKKPAGARSPGTPA